jgi:hypothetical protein
VPKILVDGRVSVKTHLTLWLALSLGCASPAQTAASNPPATSASQQPAVQEQATQTDFTSKKGFVLEDETPVRLRLNRTISSADAHVGDTVDFETLDDITVNGTLIIPKGGLAFATVTEAQAKRRMARGGKLDINIDYVKLLSGEKAALRAVKDVKGGGHTGGMVGGMVATSLIFFPAAPFFLFMHGKDISIPKGTEITAYTNGDMRLDIAKFQATGPADAPVEGKATSSSGAATSPATAKSTSQGTRSSGAEASVVPVALSKVPDARLSVSSTPDNADIEIDGGFVGNTPSVVDVATGEHSVVVKKNGYQTWERKLEVTGGEIKLNADLEKKTEPDK